jgi:amino acid transporter
MSPSDGLGGPAEAPLAGPPAGLRRNYLTLFEVVAQAVGVIAPSVMPVLALPSVFAMAGYGSWLTYLVATVALLLVSLSIGEFARREASPGSLYVVASKGLGRIWGVVAGWSLLVGYTFTGAAVISGAANYLLIIFDLPTIKTGGAPLAIGFSVLVVLGAGYLAYRDVKLSTRTMMAIECATVLAIASLVAIALARRGLAVDPHQLNLDGLSSRGVRLGLVLAFFSFVGFESATVVGVESRRPFVTVPVAVVSSVLLSGAFFTLVAYGTVAAFHGLTPSLDTSAAPLNAIAASIGLAWAGKLVSIGIALSCLACVIASLNAGGRILFALSRHGLAHGSTGRVHAVHSTPHAAVGVIAGVALAASIALSLVHTDLIEAFGYFGTLASFGFIAVYLLVSIGTPLYLSRLGALRPWHVGVSAASILLILVALEGSLYPPPEGPTRTIPYIFLGIVAVGVGYFAFLKSRRPEALQALEAELLSGP